MAFTLPPEIVAFAPVLVRASTLPPVMVKTPSLVSLSATAALPLSFSVPETVFSKLVTVPPLKSAVPLFSTVLMLPPEIVREPPLTTTVSTEPLLTVKLSLLEMESARPPSRVNTPEFITAPKAAPFPAAAAPLSFVRVLIVPAVKSRFPPLSVNVSITLVESMFSVLLLPVAVTLDSVTFFCRASLPWSSRLTLILELCEEVPLFCSVRLPATSTEAALDKSTLETSTVKDAPLETVKVCPPMSHL